MSLRTMLTSLLSCSRLFLFFFFNDTATTEIYTLSLHDALPIYVLEASDRYAEVLEVCERALGLARRRGDRRWESNLLTDRKSTRLNSSHDQISYAVFCLKKKKKNNNEHKDTTRR